MEQGGTAFCESIFLAYARGYFNILILMKFSWYQDFPFKLCLYVQLQLLSKNKKKILSQKQSKSSSN